MTSTPQHTVKAEQFLHTACVLIRLLENANRLLLCHCEVCFEPTGWILGLGGLKGD